MREFLWRGSSLKIDALGLQRGLGAIVAAVLADGLLEGFDGVFEAPGFFVQLAGEEVGLGDVGVGGEEGFDLFERLGDLALLGVDPPQQQASVDGIRQGLDALLANNHGLHEAAKFEIGVRQRNEGLRVGGEGHLKLRKVLLRGVAHDLPTVEELF